MGQRKPFDPFGRMRTPRRWSRLGWMFVASWTILLASAIGIAAYAYYSSPDSESFRVFVEGRGRHETKASYVLSPAIVATLGYAIALAQAVTGWRWGAKEGRDDPFGPFVTIWLILVCAFGWLQCLRVLAAT